MIVQLTDDVLLPFHILDQNLFQIINAHACVVIRGFFVYVFVFNNGCMSGFGISLMSGTVSSFAIGFKCADMIGWGARMLNTLRKTDKSFLLQSVASTDECGFSHTSRCTDDGRGAGNRHLPIVVVRLVEQIEVECRLCHGELRVAVGLPKAINQLDILHDYIPQLDFGLCLTVMRICSAILSVVCEEASCLAPSIHAINSERLNWSILPG